MYHKSVPVVLYANPSTVGTPYLAIPCAQSQAKNEAFRGVSGPTSADPVICQMDSENFLDINIDRKYPILSIPDSFRPIQALRKVPRTYLEIYPR